MIGAGLIGCGAIGTVIAEAIDNGKAGNINLVIIYDLIRERSKLLASKLSHKPLIAESFDEILRREDVHLVIEAASQEAVRQYAVKILNNNKDLMVMSAGALVDDYLLAEIMKAAKENKRKVYVPSGAIVGLDNIKSASVGQIEEVTLTTRKPPISFKGAPYVEKSKIDLSSLREPLILFEGPAREAVKLFPQNVNVAATLSLAGVGPDKTKVRIIVDPTIKNIIHEIHVKGEFGEIYTKTENRPFPTNPKTSFIAALSAIATLRRISESVIVGT
ncbi:MAG: aspartate dehydrogenase [Candidatus Bathyarchaeia archaeon]